MSAPVSVPSVRIDVGGAALDEALMATLVQVEVERAWNAPALLSLRFGDPPSDGLHHEPLPPGAAVRVRVDDGSGHRDLGRFEVTESRWTYAPDGGLDLEVLALDKLHRLDRRSSNVHVRTGTLRTALNKAMDGTLGGPKGDVPSRSYPSVLQARGTDLALIRRLCRAAARRFHLDGDDLRLVKPGETRGRPVALTLGVDLLSLEVARSIEGQLGSVEARAWNPETQRAEVATARAPERGDFSRPAEAPKAAPIRVHERPLPDRKDAQLLAQGVMDGVADRSLHIEGVCEGWLGVELGGAIELKEVAPIHAGTYAVDRVLHRIDAEDGWTTRFEVGAPPQEPPPTPDASPLVCTPAVVIDVKDPDQRGRVRVRYEALGEDLESDWLRVVHPGAGDGGGQFIVPHVGDEVLVILESESLDAGYVLGGLYSRANKPGSAFDQGATPVQGFRTRKGHQVLIDDSKDILELRLERGSKLRIRNGNILLSSGGSIDIKDGHGNSLGMEGGGVTLKSDGSMDLVANNKINLSGGTVRIAGSRIDFVKT